MPHLEEQMVGESSKRKRSFPQQAFQVSDGFALFGVLMQLKVKKMLKKRKYKKKCPLVKSKSKKPSSTLFVELKCSSYYIA